MTKVKLNGKMMEQDILACKMDEDLRHDLLIKSEWEGIQKFVDRYCIEHEKRFGRKFDIKE